MILSLLFIFLFVVLVSALLIFIFSMLLPSMKAEGIEIQSPVLSLEEKNYNEDVSPTHSANPAMMAKLDEMAFVLDKSLKKRMEFSGVKSCILFHDNYQTQYFTLEKKCIGFGDCVKVCTQKAMKIKNNMLTVTKMCAGCGRCIEACPVKIISLVKKDNNITENEKNGFKFLKKCYKIFSRVGK